MSEYPVLRFQADTSQQHVPAEVTVVSTSRLVAANGRSDWPPRLVFVAIQIRRREE
jgi:hypothetical protein